MSRLNAELANKLCELSLESVIVRIKDAALRVTTAADDKRAVSGRRRPIDVSPLIALVYTPDANLLWLISNGSVDILKFDKTNGDYRERATVDLWAHISARRHADMSVVR